MTRQGGWNDGMLEGWKVGKPGIKRRKLRS